MLHPSYADLIKVVNSEVEVTMSWWTAEGKSLFPWLWKN